MPELTWVGKEKVITHHLDVPYKVLERQYSFDEHGKHAEDSGSSNMIIHGDNLEALKALLPQYEGKVDCIYIDPPYNTGNEGWIYNDNVTDPRIRKWLGEVVGKEGEDLSRHDKWLCMMYPRLRLLSRLLASTGSMAISLSHHELPNLLEILNEIFAARSITTTIVQTSGGKPSGGFNFVHEFLVFITPKDFSPNASTQVEGKVRTPFEGLTLSTFDKVQRPNQVYPIFVDSSTLKFRGTGPSLQELINRGLYTGEKEDFVYSTKDVPEGCDAVWPITVKGKECVWRQIPSRLQADWEKGYIKISRTSDRISVQYLPRGVIKKIQEGQLEVVGTEPGVPTLRFGENRTAGTQIPTLLSNKEYFTVRGTTELSAIFPERNKVFDYPKPSALIKYVVESLTPKDGIVLDSFAGSGTTGHAVIELNHETGSKRKFILVELGDYAEEVTATRVDRIITGYGSGKNRVKGLGGGYSFYELGVPLMVDGLLNAEVDVERIREFIWYTETRQSEPPTHNEEFPFYLGTAQHCAYHFIYDPDRVMTLSRDYVAHLSEEVRSGSLIIYADVCTMSQQELAAVNVNFKKIPRDITRF